MTLSKFINQFDKEGAIVLLEGKRDVLAEDKTKLIQLGKLLALNTNKMIFRSGNAEGADELFFEGVLSVDKNRLQVITPYKSHRQKNNLATETFSLDEINIAAETEVVYQSKKNKGVVKLIDQYVSGIKNRNSMKAAYILRDTIKVIGTENISPATFGIFYDNMEKPMSGGTGHTMKVCEENSIPLIDQTIWFSWLQK